MRSHWSTFTWEKIKKKKGKGGSSDLGLAAAREFIFFTRVLLGGKGESVGRRSEATGGGSTHPFLNKNPVARGGKDFPGENLLLLKTSNFSEKRRCENERRGKRKGQVFFFWGGRQILGRKKKIPPDYSITFLLGGRKNQSWRGRKHLRIIIKNPPATSSGGKERQSSRLWASPTRRVATAPLFKTCKEKRGRPLPGSGGTRARLRAPWKSPSRSQHENLLSQTER